MEGKVNEKKGRILCILNWSIIIIIDSLSYLKSSWCKAMDYGIEVREFDLQSFTFGQIPLENLCFPIF